MGVDKPCYRSSTTAYSSACKKVKTNKIWIDLLLPDQSACRHVKQYWIVSLYYAFIDHMIMELESRLIKSENRFYAEYLLPRVIGNIRNEQIATLFETYQTDLTYTSRRIQEESLDKGVDISMPTSLFIHLYTVYDQCLLSRRTDFGQFYVRKFCLYEINVLLMYSMLTRYDKLPQRDRSVYTSVEDITRSTMNNDRLSSLALMHIHRDFSVDLDRVMEKFVSAKTRRTDFGLLRKFCLMKSMCCLCIQFTHENTSERTILHHSIGGGGANPTRPPLPLPGLVACISPKRQLLPLL